MWPFHDAFTRGLRKCALEQTVCRQPEENPNDHTMDSLDMDFAGFFNIPCHRLGELCALIFAQAQADGVTRVKLHYGINKMIYTIDGVDYEMVSIPSPANVDLVRSLAKTSCMTWEKPGMLPIRFADLTLMLSVNHHAQLEDPFLEITGFTGEPCACANGTPRRHERSVVFDSSDES